jgi:PIN domain nuclease of toxin-antitoxin system
VTAGVSRAESAPPPTSVLDASALLAVLYAETGRPVVVEAIADGAAADVQLIR